MAKAKSTRMLASMAKTNGMIPIQLVVDLPKSAYAKKGVKAPEAENIDVLMWAVPRLDEQITLEDGRTLMVKGVRHAVPKAGDCLTFVRIG